MYQFEEIAKTVDYWNLTTAEALFRSGFNQKNIISPQVAQQNSLVIIDNTDSLSNDILQYVAKTFKNVLIFANQPSYMSPADNVTLFKSTNFDLAIVLECLYTDYKIDYLTIQAGGKLNALFSAS